MRDRMENFFTQYAAWHEKIGKIYALLERVKISEEQSADKHIRPPRKIIFDSAPEVRNVNNRLVGAYCIRPSAPEVRHVVTILEETY